MSKIHCFVTKMATLQTTFVILSLSVLFVLFSDEIWASNTSPRFMFSDKTPYHFKRNAIVKPPECEAVHLNMVIRHGSRYPGSYRVNKMKKMLEKINQVFPSNSTIHYKGLSLPWNIPNDILQAASKEISALGSEEMYSIARRLLAEFRSVLEHGYSNTNYSFVATDKLRSSQSAVAFAQGLFEGKGKVGSAKYQPVAVKFSGSYDDDSVLRIFEACPKWQKITEKKRSRSEHAKFLNGPEMREVVQKIAERLKLRKKILLTPQMVVEMFLMCAFGIQTDSADSSWCEVFEEADLKVLEYLNDLKLYWDRSYGREINYKMGCQLYAEIIDSFEGFLQSGKPHGIFRFAHTGTVIPLLTMLGLYNDTIPPTAGNFHQQANRKFRISDVVPMGGNVAFLLYKCNKERPENKSKSDTEGESDCAGHCHISNMTIQMLVNEAPVPMPACGGRMYCRLKNFLSYYSHIKDTCDIRTICGRRRKCKNRGGPQD